MSEIYCRGCGVNTTHTAENYYVRSTHGNDAGDWLLMFFKTDFLYKNPDTLMRGCQYSYILYPPYTSAEHGSLDVGFVNDWIFIVGEEVGKIVDQFSLPLCTPFSLDKHSLIEPYIKRIETERKLKLNCYEKQVSALITQMLVSLGRRYEEVHKNTQSSYEAISNARTYMLNHIEDNISIKELAERANYSVSRFCVLYSRFFSVTPVEDLLNARIEKAMSLLKYNQLSVTQTAELCGFSSIHYFSRKFKEKTGAMPSHFLK